MIPLKTQKTNTEHPLKPERGKMYVGRAKSWNDEDPNGIFIIGYSYEGQKDHPILLSLIGNFAGDTSPYCWIAPDMDSVIFVREFKGTLTEE